MLTDNAADARHAASEVRTLLDEAGIKASVSTVGMNDWASSVLLGSTGETARVSGREEQIDAAVTVAVPHTAPGADTRAGRSLAPAARRA